MKFLVATDGSQSSERALEHALSITTAADAEMAVVSVVDPEVREFPAADEPIDIGDVEGNLIRESIDDAERRTERILENARAMATAEDVEPKTEMLYGDPVESIAEFAAEKEYDGIFVGHRGLSEAAERVVGSVAKGLVERSQVPVTVVRETA